MTREATGSMPRTRGGAGEVFLVALRLGLTSFGGPTAHLAAFQREYVARRRWLSDPTFAGLVAMSQVLPGPASSQVGIGIGLLRAGYPGALAAWLGFTLPSAAIMTTLAILAGGLDLADAGWVHGLELAAAAIVASAIVALWRSLAPDAARSLIAVAAALVLLAIGGAATQLLVIVGAAAVGWRLLRGVVPEPESEPLGEPVSGRVAAAALVTFASLLVGLPILATFTGSEPIAAVDAFYRAGSLVFGGAHVVLPLLDELVVAPGWVTDEQFVAGYGAAQALPGPLFTFGAYLGAIATPLPGGVAGGLIAIVAIFLPSFLLVLGAVPSWSRLRSSARFRGALAGVNAAVVGLILAALYDPILTSAARTALDVGLIVAAFVALRLRNVPPWLVVAALAATAQVLRGSGLA